MMNSSNNRKSWFGAAAVAALVLGAALLWVGLKPAGSLPIPWSAIPGGVAMAASGIDLKGRENAPPLNEKEWFNTDGPLSFDKELKDKIVLLDFWTYCCINCIHIIPDLKKLEQKYENELVVIGVHSAKFENEKDGKNILAAMKRYGIMHPVVNDKNMRIWDAYGVRAWPTLVLIAPGGKIVGSVSGEGNYELLDRLIGEMIEMHGDKLDTSTSLLVDHGPMDLKSLSFPGKVTADEQSGRLYITDTGHNRIVISDFDGKVLDTAGAGEEGLKDGSFESALFTKPQGTELSADGRYLYVADTENHALRRLDLKARTVETVAGTGEQAKWRAGGGNGKTTELNSPWDLTRIGDSEKIYIAMAGPHQLWVYDPATGKVDVFAGSGYENIDDGRLLGAALAQPSGMTSDGQNIYFADSEVSALRMAELDDSGGVIRTLIGKGLFHFGDVDGGFNQAKLQHPLGVKYSGGKVYVADSYNHKVKVADLDRMSISTLAGTGEPGASEQMFNEPGGLDLADGRIWVADTNNHAIKIVDPATGHMWTMALEFH